MLLASLGYSSDEGGSSCQLVDCGGLAMDTVASLDCGTVSSFCLQIE